MTVAPAERVDVLVVGAGPTGLVLAAALHAGGAHVRIVDRNADPVHESRALAVQPRTLEVLRGLGLADELVRRGSTTVRLDVHAGARTVPVELFDIGLDDTAFPSLLFVSQAETEAVLGEHLARVGVTVERGVRFEGCEEAADGVTAELTAADGTRSRLQARYLVGCDGGRSRVREAAGIPFLGGGYPQTFVLADLDVDGLAGGAVHAFLTDTGPVLFFPLGTPAPWRLIAMTSARDDGAASDVPAADGGAAGDPAAGGGTGGAAADGSVSLGTLQAVADGATNGRLRLHDPVWSSAFRLHHRQAASYRAGRVFLAGDAAHVHSPVGAQGMNTGIQDAHNLGWKLALVCRGTSPEEVLDSYDAERRPVGAFVLRFTDRGFAVVTSSNRVVRTVRTRVVPRLIPLALRLPGGRARAFRTVAELSISYPDSPAVAGRRRLSRRRPRPGDRLPDGLLMRDGAEVWLQEALAAAAFHLLLVGPAGGWDERELAALEDRYGAALEVHRLDRAPAAGVLHDRTGNVTRRLHVHGAASFVVRPDGHVGHRGDDVDLGGATRYLARWIRPSSA